MGDRQDLASRMLALADADQLPVGHELRVLANQLEVTAKGFYSEPQTHTVQEMLQAWTTARKAWCAYVGEPVL